MRTERKGLPKSGKIKEFSRFLLEELYYSLICFYMSDELSFQRDRWLFLKYLQAQGSSNIWI